MDDLRFERYRKLDTNDEDSLIEPSTNHKIASPANETGGFFAHVPREVRSGSRQPEETRELRVQPTAAKRAGKSVA